MDLIKIGFSVNQIVNLDDYVVLDIETTGFSPLKGGRIIEIGAIHVKNGEIVATYNELIHPEMKKIPAEITKLTGITSEDLIGKPTFREELPRFFEFIKGKTIIAHNAQFDWDRYLLYFFDKSGIQAPNKTVDTMKLSKYLFPEDSKHNLDVLSEKFEIEKRDKHRALGDVYMTYEIFKRFQALLIERYGTSQLSLVENTPSVIEEEKFEYAEFTIRHASFWEKKNSNRVLFRRIYLMLDIGQIYFDIMTKTWGNQSTKENIDFKEVERRLLSSPTKLNQLKGKVTKDMLFDFFGLTEDDLKVTIKENDEQFEVKRVAYWQKSNLKRIYVTLNIGILYLDVQKREWGNKSVSKTINFKALESKIFNLVGVSSIDELCQFTGDKKVA